MSEASVAELPAAAATAAAEPAAAPASPAAAAVTDAAVTDEDAEIEAMRARVAEMEEEARRMSEAAGGAPSAPASGSGGRDASASGLNSPGAPSGRPPPVSSEQAAEQDSRSIHVSQVDYSCSEEELRRLFEACGPVARATILKDRFTGAPKGFAYIEFVSADAIENAMILNDTEFKGRTLKITPKRTNIPGFMRGGRGGRGRGGGGRGGGAGGDVGGVDPAAAQGGQGYGPIRGRGGRGRGRGRGGYHPYQQYQY